MWLGEAKGLSSSTRLVGASCARDAHNECCIKQKVDDGVQVAHHFGAKR